MERYQRLVPCDTKPVLHLESSCYPPYLRATVLPSVPWQSTYPPVIGPDSQMPTSSFNASFSFVYNCATHHSARTCDEHISPSEWGTIRFLSYCYPWDFFLRHKSGGGTGKDWVKSTLAAAPTNEFIREDKLSKTRHGDSIHPERT